MGSEGGERTKTAQWRVAVLTDNYGGGTGSHLNEILSRRNLKEWPTEVICFGADTGLRPPPDVPFFQRRFRSFWVRIPVPQIRALRNLIRRLPPRPSILHTYFFWPIMYGRILKGIGRISILVENREDTGFKWQWMHRWALQKIRPRPDLVICVSRAVREATLQNEALPPSNVVVVENGVALPALPLSVREAARRTLGVEPHHVLIGIVANLHSPVKAVDRFIDAMPVILAGAPEARFVVAGTGKLRPTLEQQAKRLGVEGHLRFLGHVSDVHTLYRAMDISVLTSRSEGLSITLLESMAHGLPVVVTAVGGNVDVVADGETGYLVPFGDSEAFASAVVELAGDAQRREQMGAAGRRLCEDRFDIASVSARYEAHYASLIAKHLDDNPA